MSEVSLDEIMVESVPGKSATGVAASVEVISVLSEAEKFICPKDTDSVDVISVVSVRVNATAPKELASVPVICVESVADLATVANSDVSADEI